MQRYGELKNYIKKFNKVIVAFSGGIDSYLVLKASVDSIGRENVLAVTGDSPSLKESDKILTALLAASVNAQHEIIFTEELNDPNYFNNPANRCFYCKNELFTKLVEISRQMNYDNVLDGTNYDDMSDYRPGFQASKGHNVVSPLVDCKFTKEEIRKISKELGLTIWNKPSSPCLSSRIPYGQQVTLEKLSLIQKAEDIIKEYGFRNYRVRHFEFKGNDVFRKTIKLAKIDISKDEMNRIFSENLFEVINNKLKNIGFDFITLDMNGLSSGSLNVHISMPSTNNKD
jgi:uncharacterized protein